MQKRFKVKKETTIKIKANKYCKEKFSIPEIAI